MSITGNPGNRETVQKNLLEAERLIAQNKNNLAMIKLRQTLEYMIKLQCDRAGVVEEAPDNMVRNLYRGQWISKTTAERYLKILAIGNSAEDSGDNSGDNARLAFRLLRAEANSGSEADKQRTASRSSGAETPARQFSAMETRTEPRSGAGRHSASGQRSAGQRSSSDRRRSDDMRRSSSARSSRSRKKRRSGLGGPETLKLLIPIVLVIVLLFVIRTLSSSKSATEETTTAPVTTEAPTTMAPETEPETEPETTAAPIIYKTTDILNVRSEPSTSSSKLGKLQKGTVVEYVGDENDSWAVIMYNGEQGYVSKEFLTEAEPETTSEAAATAAE